MKNTELVTVNELIECIGRYMRKDADSTDEAGSVNDTTDIRIYGLRRKWLEPQDVSRGDTPIERRQAARILHEFLKRELQKPDLPDWEPAKELLDLYDCRTCVNHVAQVYGRGIMKGITEHVFGMREGVLREELEPMVERLFERKRDV